MFVRQYISSMQQAKPQHHCYCTAIWKQLSCRPHLSVNINQPSSTTELISTGHHTIWMIMDDNIYDSQIPKLFCEDSELIFNQRWRSVSLTFFFDLNTQCSLTQSHNNFVSSNSNTFINVTCKLQYRTARPNLRPTINTARQFDFRK